MLLMYLHRAQPSASGYLGPGVGIQSRVLRSLLVEEGLEDDDFVPRLDEGHEGTEHT